MLCSIEEVYPDLESFYSRHLKESIRLGWILSEDLNQETTYVLHLKMNGHFDQRNSKKASHDIVVGGCNFSIAIEAKSGHVLASQYMTEVVFTCNGKVPITGGRLCALLTGFMAQVDIQYNENQSRFRCAKISIMHTYKSISSAEGRAGDTFLTIFSPIELRRTADQVQHFLDYWRGCMSQHVSLQRRDTFFHFIEQKVTHLSGPTDDIFKASCPCQTESCQGAFSFDSQDVCTK